MLPPAQRPSGRRRLPLLNDTELLAAFESRTLPADAWSHRAHLRVAWLHARQYALDEAHLRLRVGIIRLNLAHGLVETAERGYHETLTRVWLALVAGLAACADDTDSDAFVGRNASALEKAAPLRHYSRERLLSLEARAVFLAPDVTPLPSPDQPPR